MSGTCASDLRLTVTFATPLPRPISRTVPTSTPSKVTFAPAGRLRALANWMVTEKLSLKVSGILMRAGFTEQPESPTAISAVNVTIGFLTVDCLP
ncbi:Uncharacterised protein [Mycobacteroides abscessus subsp. massiliense]|nr:Uncharacterised protein [Mycobacteroides abscessus subsp. massiliense]